MSAHFVLTVTHIGAATANRRLDAAASLSSYALTGEINDFDAVFVATILVLEQAQRFLTIAAAEREAVTV